MRPTDDAILDVLPALRRYARSLSRHHADAEDLLQDSVEMALSRSSSWRGDNLRAWIVAVMTNLHRNRHRRRGLFSRFVAEQQALANVPADDAFERGRLAAALDALSPDERAVLMLVVIEGYRYAEVAEMLRIPIGTVMSRLSRARSKLSEQWQGENVVDFRRSS